MKNVVIFFKSIASGMLGIMVEIMAVAVLILAGFLASFLWWRAGA